jgi:hypothetical protein
MRFALVTAVVVVGGCVGSMPSGSDATGGNGGAAQDSTADAGVDGVADLAPPADLHPRPAPPDLVSSDLAGLVDCFGATVCDPTMSFCIRLHSGSASNAGTTQPPACYQPTDCMGANMNCDCITQDAVLGPSCLNCVDHMDGTYDCYAQQ